VEDKDRLQICWQAFSMENSLLQSYRMLFTMVEAALLALTYVLLVPAIKEPKQLWMIWVAAGFGWGVVIAWIMICKAKGKDVDRWTDRILGFQPKIEKEWSIIGKGWFDYLKPEVPKSWFKHPTLWFKFLWVQFKGGRVARILFNWIIPLLMAGLWGVVVYVALN